MDPQAFLDHLTADPETDGSLVHVQDLPARAPLVRPFPADLPDVLVGRLGLLGIEGLYPHQAEGLEALADGRDVMLATGTASGKSLVYQLAFAHAALTVPKATALFLFPTKALARDQLRSVRSLKLPQLKASVYDGDTPRAERPLIRTNANLVLTNPDMLHASLLPDHARWADFFLRLSLVVVDEAHVLRGVFGSQVAMVLRRLRRLIAAHGGDPRWCLATATVGNPGELASRLTGLDVEVVERDASPRGRKLFALWNPPVIDEETGARRSALTEASWVMTGLVERGARTIGFTRSRRAAELLAEFTRRGLSDAQLRTRVKSYRAGYLAEDRRAIERQLADGELVAVASTNALELGIDIGSLDAAVLTGYPGTRASMWQQAGRAGRREAESLAVLVAQDDPLDQYLAQHHEELFDRPAEDAVIDPTNPYVMGPHLRCAARELPLAPDDVGTFFGPQAEPLLEQLIADGALARRTGGTVHDVGRTSPHREVDIRAGSGHVYRIVLRGTGELLGTSDEHRAFGTLHPGAVYLHQGEQFLVQELNLTDRVAVVAEADPDFYTQARDVTDIQIVDVRERRALGDAEVWFGDVQVTNQVVGLRPEARVDQRGRRGPSPRAAAGHPRDARDVVDDPRQALRRGIGRPAPAPGRDPRGRALRDRPPAAGRDLRPLGRRRRVHARARGHRPHHDLRLRRLRGWRRRHRAGLPQRRTMVARDARAAPRLSVSRRLPVLRAVTEVRQRQRAAGQGGRGRAARRPAPRVIGVVTLLDRAHLAEVIGERLAGVRVGGLDAVARGLGGGDEDDATDVRDFAHPMDRPRHTGVRGHDEGEREDDRRDHRSEESLHRGPLSP